MSTTPLTLGNINQIVTDILRTDPAFFSLDFPILSHGTENYSKTFEQAVQNQGLVLVLINMGAMTPKPEASPILLHNHLMISVVENLKSNKTGVSAFQAVEIILRLLHQAPCGNPYIRNNIEMQSPAYELGPIDSGLVTYFCHFRIKSLDTPKRN